MKTKLYCPKCGCLPLKNTSTNVQSFLERTKAHCSCGWIGSKTDLISEKEIDVEKMMWRTKEIRDVIDKAEFNFLMKYIEEKAKEKIC
jgi:hypothetical protein